MQKRQQIILETIDNLMEAIPGISKRTPERYPIPDGRGTPDLWPSRDDTAPYPTPGGLKPRPDFPRPRPFPIRPFPGDGIRPRPFPIRPFPGDGLRPKPDYPRLPTPRPFPGGGKDYLPTGQDYGPYIPRPKVRSIPEREMMKAEMLMPTRNIPQRDTNVRM